MLNRKLYSRIYRDNPGDPLHPVYVGSSYEKQSGIPAHRFRLLGLGISAVCFLCLLGAGLLPSAASKALYTLPFYAAAFLPAVLGFVAVWQAPDHDQPIREDTYHFSFGRIKPCAAMGMGLAGLAFLGGILAASLSGHFSGTDFLYLTLTLISAIAFLALWQLQKKQNYLLKKS